MSSRRKGKLKDAPPGVHSRNANAGTLDSIESFLARLAKYRFLLVLIVAIIGLGGWVLDRTLFRSTPNQPVVQVYNSLAEKVSPVVRSYFAMPFYTTLRIKPGVSVGFVHDEVLDYRVRCGEKVGDKMYVFLSVPGEGFEKAFALSQENFFPFTVFIQRQDRRFLLTVEAVDDDGILVRNYKEVS